MSEREYEKYINTLLNGRFQLKKIIGTGGMAVVFEAVEIFTQKTVAIKMLKESCSGDANSVNVKRFVNEVRAIAMLNNDNIVKVYDFSVDGPQKYIVMEYIAGTPLKEYMDKKGGKISVDETLHFVSQILDALEHAHIHGIIHRDIKPQNIMVLPGGKIKVMDFGIAKIPKTESLTLADKAIGTVYYISPEQAKAKNIDARSDLYSLGVMMYEMITGKLPFFGESHVEIIMKHVNGTPDAICENHPEIPKGLEQIIFHAMEKDPAKRYQNAPQMSRHIKRLSDDKTITFRYNQKNSITGEIQLAEPPKQQIPAKKPQRSQQGARKPIRKSNEYNHSVKTDKQLLNVSLILLAVLVVALFVVGFFLWKTVFFPAPEIVDNGISTEIIDGENVLYMPNVASLDVVQAKAILKNCGIDTQIITIPDENTAIGNVIFTFPSANTQITDNKAVLYISLGNDDDTYMLSDYTGMTLNDAKIELCEKGVDIGNITFASSSFPVGQIISQSITAYTALCGSQTIDFVVSGGSAYVG